MPSFRHLLLPITFALAATTTAATCPQNWLEDTALDGDSKCCYGNMVIEGRDAYCCVYDMTPDLETSSVSTTTTTGTVGWSTAGDCFAKIPFTASDYSDQVSSASSKITAVTTTIATNEATSTTTKSSSSSTTTSGATPGASSGTSSSTSTNTSPGTKAATTNAAMSVATAQGIVLGGAAVVVGLFVL